MINKVLIVAGMHRSGTSLVAQWLHKCGLQMGEALLGPGIGNADGHFEDIDFLNFHEEVLKNQQLGESGLTEKSVLEIQSDDREKLKSIIERKNKSNSEWGWKDPRTCLFLSAYADLIPDARYLIVIRDYQSTVNSLISRKFKRSDIKHRGLLDNFIWKIIRGNLRKKKLYKEFTEQYVKVWIAYNKAILNHISKKAENSYLVLDYNMLKTKDKQVFLFLKDNWNFTLEYFDFKNIYKESFMNKADNIEVFVKDRQLIETAKKLENDLRALMKFN